MYCGEHTIVNEHCDDWVAVSMRCKSWKCELCHPDRRKRLIAEAFAGKANRFITLTVSPGWGEGPVHRAEQLSRAWRNIVKCLKRRYPNTPIEYLCVFEAQESGEPHLHILYRGPWVDQRWLSAQMKARMDAPIVWVAKVRNRGAINAYVAKYIGKASEKFGTLKRYWSSKRWDPAKPEETKGFRPLPGDWQRWSFEIGQLAGIWQKQGFDCWYEGRLLKCDRTSRYQRSLAAAIGPP